MRNSELYQWALTYGEVVAQTTRTMPGSPAEYIAKTVLHTGKLSFPIGTNFDFILNNLIPNRWGAAFALANASTIRGMRAWQQLAEVLHVLSFAYDGDIRDDLRDLKAIAESHAHDLFVR